MAQTMPHDRISLMRARLTEALSPDYLEITDDSDKHIGHAGAQSGGGHFTVHIKSVAFEGKSLITSHRLIYQALGDMMKKEIHALKIQIISF